MDGEHDDDLDSTVEQRDEMETDDYPTTGDELEDEPAESEDDGGDEGIVGK